MPEDDPLARERMRLEGRIRERQIAEESRLRQQRAQLEARRIENDRRADERGERDAVRRDVAERRHRERLEAQEQRYRETTALRERQRTERQEGMKYAADRRQETALTLAENKQSAALALADMSSETSLRLAQIKERADLQYLQAQQSGDLERIRAAHELQRDILHLEHELFLERENILEQGRRFEFEREQERLGYIAELDQEAALQAIEDEAYLRVIDAYARQIDAAQAHKHELERMRLEADIRAAEDARTLHFDLVRRAQETDETLREEGGMVDIRHRERLLIQGATPRYEPPHTVMGSQFPANDDDPLSQ